MLPQWLTKNTLTSCGTGRFDFSMMVPTAALQSADVGEKTVAFLRAVQPLGLRLVAKKADLDVMVVDGVERPGGN